MPDQIVDGASIHYESYGSGEPLLLLHGFTATGKQWAPFVPELERDYRLIVPDLPGHGRSAVPNGSYTHRMAAQSMQKLLDLLQVERLRAIGFSSGAMTLIHMATNQPDRIQRMVLWSGTSYFPKQCRDIMSSVDADAITERELPWLVDHAGGREQSRWVLRQFHDLKDSYDDMNFTPPFLSTIKARTLIIHGDRDEYFPARMAVELYEAIPGAYLWIVPNAQHFFPEQVIPEVVRECKDFMAGRWEAPPD